MFAPHTLVCPPLKYFCPIMVCFLVAALPPGRDNYRKAPYPRTQQRVQIGWELNPNHAIVITRSP